MSMEQLVQRVNEFHVKHKLLLITGNPGSGKTTLMRYLAKEWAEGKVLQSCRILLLIHLGECVKDHRSLRDLLKDTEYDGHKDIDQIASLIQGNHGEGTCFLLDAYDEKPAKRDFLDKLINLNHLRHSLRIVTSRPSFANQIKHQAHIEIIGFSEESVEYYISQLPGDAQSSLQRLLEKHSVVWEVCQSPLYLSLIAYIVVLDPDRVISLSTRTQVYLHVMESLVTHYQDGHRKWNAGSLRDCIIKKPHCSDNMLCCAFNTLQRVGFDIVFRDRRKFEMEEFSLHSSIKSLSIVSIHPVSPNEVTYSFAHRTFTEFFAALYLTTLPQDQQLFYITRYNDKGLRHVVWQFFFGVMGEYYSKNITTLSTVLKRYFSVDHYSSMNSFCYQYCSAENRASITRTSLEAIRELGWAAKDYGQIYASTGIVMNSTVFAEGINPKYYSDVYFMHLLADFLEVATVHKLCYHGMFDFAIVIEDWTQKLNKTHLEFIIRSVKPVDPVVLPETSFVTFLSFKYSTFEFASQKFMQYVQHFFGNDWSTESIQMLKMFQILFRTQSLPNFTYVDLGISFNHSVNYTWLSSFTSIRALEFGAPLSSFQLSAVLRKPRELHSLQLHSLHCTDLPLVLDGLTELKHVFQISADAPMFL